MKYFVVTAKMGHVGRHSYYRGRLYIATSSKKEAARLARGVPRVKHDRKDAIIDVVEIDFSSYVAGQERNRQIAYFSCTCPQEQRSCFYQIEDDVFLEESYEKRLLEDKRTEQRRCLNKTSKTRRVINDDPEYELYRRRGSIDLSDAS